MEKTKNRVIPDRVRNVLETLELLKERFPKAFKDDPAPLKVGIVDDLIAVLSEELSKTQLRKAVKYYANSSQYHQGILVGGYRINLNGEQCEPVTEEHKEYSQKRLGEMIANLKKPKRR